MILTATNDFSMLCCDWIIEAFPLQSKQPVKMLNGYDAGRSWRKASVSHLQTSVLRRNSLIRNSQRVLRIKSMATSADGTQPWTWSAAVLGWPGKKIVLAICTVFNTQDNLCIFWLWIIVLHVTGTKRVDLWAPRSVLIEQHLEEIHYWPSVSPANKFHFSTGFKIEQRRMSA